MNWDQIESKWTEMTQRVRSGGPPQGKSAVAPGLGEKAGTFVATTSGEVLADLAAEISDSATVA
jgi:hypothetical protein